MYVDRQFKPGVIYPIIVAIFMAALLGATLIYAGLPPFVIFTTAAVIAYVAWLLTTYKRPADPQRVLPLYLLALAFQIIHTTEEYLADFPAELAELFRIAEPANRNVFAVAIMGGAATMWVLTGFGLLCRNPFANYLLWFFVIGPGLVNSVAHLAFPIIARTVYFPGLITVLLPTIVSILVIRRLLSSGTKAENTQ